MDPEFLGYDPHTGLALFRSVDGIISRVDATKSPFAQEVIARSQQPALDAKPRDAQGLPPATLRDATITPRPPNATLVPHRTPYTTVPNATISPSAHAQRRAQRGR